MRDLYSDIGQKFPELCFDIVDYFSDHTKKSRSEERLKLHFYKDFADFMFDHMDKYHVRNNILQPNDFEKICNILCEKKILEKIIPATVTQIAGMGAFYSCWINRDSIANEKIRKGLTRKFNGLVYGFRYVYDNSKNKVLPLFVKLDDRDEPHIGTCFVTDLGIVTAKHCIERAKWIAIKGIGKSILEQPNVKIYTSTKYDLAMINYSFDFLNNFTIDNGKVLDEVMGLGYPQHSGFDNFLTATTGSIAAVEESYMYKHPLILTTVKLKGGNSGGPLINKEGDVVGVLTEEALSEGGDYDKFGYGIAIPISMEIIGSIIQENVILNIPFEDI